MKSYVIGEESNRNGDHFFRKWTSIFINKVVFIVATMVAITLENGKVSFLSFKFLIYFLNL